MSEPLRPASALAKGLTQEGRYRVDFVDCSGARKNQERPRLSAARGSLSGLPTMGAPVPKYFGHDSKRTTAPSSSATEKTTLPTAAPSSGRAAGRIPSVRIRTPPGVAAPARRWSTTARRRSGAVRTRSTDSDTSTSTATTPTRRRRTRGPPPTAARRH